LEPLQTTEVQAPAVSSALSKDVDTCGLTDQIKFVTNEALVLGLANFTIGEGKIISAIVHGQDFAQNLGDGFVAVLDGNYRAAGSNFGKAMDDLSTWTTGHLCTADVCYIVNGALQYFSDIGGDMKRCRQDFKSEWESFHAAFHEVSGLTDRLEWRKDTRNITAGMLHISTGLKALSDSVGACHLQELSTILGELAAKLGIAPHVAFVEGILKLRINGVEIVDDVAAAFASFANKRWADFGYGVVQLIDKLFSEEELRVLGVKGRSVQRTAEILI